MNNEQKVFWAAALQVVATGQFAYFGVMHLDKLVKLQNLPDSLLGVLAHGLIFVAMLAFGHYILRKTR